MTALVHKNNLAPKFGWEVIGTIFLMFLFTFLEFGLQGVDLPVIFVFGVSSISYFVILMLYVGIAMLSYKGHTWLIWGSGIAVYMLGYMFTGIDYAWTMFSEWSMILFGGAIIGRLSFKSEQAQKVYTYGLLSVLIFALAMYLPLLSLLTSEFAKTSADFIAKMKVALPTAGYNVEETATLLTGMQQSLSFVREIIPALVMLSAVLQFSLGYLLFMYFIARKENKPMQVASFSMWKMPYYATFVLFLGAVLRFFGNELVSHIGDNIFIFIAVFYSICGLSLMEYYLKKLKFPPIVKFSFYLLLFITQLIGFIGAIFLGFIDSFKDFRNREQLNLQNE